MQKLIKKLLESNALIIALTLTSLITILSLSKPPTNIQIPVSNLDKYLHIFAYFILATSWFFAIKKAHRISNYQIFISLAVILYGIVIEVFQGRFTADRQADIYDIFANSIGVLIAFIFFNKILKKFKAF